MTILDTDTVTLYAFGHEKVGGKINGLCAPTPLRPCKLSAPPLGSTDFLL